MTAIVALCRVATMKNAKYLAKLFVRDSSGATAIEYGLIAAAMAGTLEHVQQARLTPINPAPDYQKTISMRIART